MFFWFLDWIIVFQNRQKVAKLVSNCNFLGCRNYWQFSYLSHFEEKFCKKNKNNLKNQSKACFCSQNVLIVKISLLKLFICVSHLLRFVSKLCGFGDSISRWLLLADRCFRSMVIKINHPNQRNHISRVEIVLFGAVILHTLWLFSPTFHL